MITKKGIVVKNSGDKTLKVAVIEYRTHPKYKKRYQRTTNFLVHYEGTDIKIGDKVTIKPIRPVSKLKSWAIAETQKIK